MDLFSWINDAYQVYHLGLIFARTSGLFAAAPLFRGRNIPIPVKSGLALFLSLLLLPSFPGPAYLPTSVVGLLLQVVRELSLGLVMGFLVQMLFFTIQMAGQFADMEMGFQMANIFDPLSESQVPLMGNLFSMLSLLLYLSLNGHILLLRALGSSFQVVPPGNLTFVFSPEVIVLAFARMFVLAVQIALPLIGTSLFTGLVFGVMAKAVPQMNVFVVGMPLKVILISLMLVVVLPGLIFFMERSLGVTFLQLSEWIANGVRP